MPQRSPLRRFADASPSTRADWFSESMTNAGRDPKGDNEDLWNTEYASMIAENKDKKDKKEEDSQDQDADMNANVSNPATATASVNLVPNLTDRDYSDEFGTWADQYGLGMDFGKFAVEGDQGAWRDMFNDSNMRDWYRGETYDDGNGEFNLYNDDGTLNEENFQRLWNYQKGITLDDAIASGSYGTDADIYDSLFGYKYDTYGTRWFPTAEYSNSLPEEDWKKFNEAYLNKFDSGDEEQDRQNIIDAMKYEYFGNVINNALAKLGQDEYLDDTWGVDDINKMMNLDAYELGYVTDDGFNGNDAWRYADVFNDSGDMGDKQYTPYWDDETVLPSIGQYDRLKTVLRDDGNGYGVRKREGR